MATLKLISINSKNIGLLEASKPNIIFSNSSQIYLIKTNKFIMATLKLISIDSKNIDFG
ncbi:MAG: hypothetical protein F6K40_27140 [Okeania sp. SIO3I5]|uniref:hypothetical protein n=1 Tax=Okeania sp. SIO3I5 TaxID=2607805 RepID=UPI0013BDEAC0|nr:hypothetical protein [Okeania sp. SIO3I5]NEQ39726.1 hypothetical protein [Okeania sp. SIO3I5]